MPHTANWTTLALRTASALASVSETMTRRLRRIAQIWRNHQDVRFLQSLDDRMLRDIGLVRGDLYRAASLPFWRDPATALIRTIPRRHPGRQSLPRAPSIVPVVRDEVQGSELRPMLFF